MFYVLEAFHLPQFLFGNWSPSIFLHNMPLFISFIHFPTSASTTVSIWIDFEGFQQFRRLKDYRTRHGRRRRHGPKPVLEVKERPEVCKRIITPDQYEYYPATEGKHMSSIKEYSFTS